MQGKKLRLPRALTIASAAACGLLFSTFAYATRNVDVKMKNDSRDSNMTCVLYKHVDTHGAEVQETELERWTIRAGQTKTRSAAIKHIGRRINRSLVYPKLKLECKLSEEPNSRNHTPLWDFNDKSPDRYHLYGSCTNGRVCSMQVKR